MRVVNRKTCDGLETYVLLEATWIRLADLPAVLRMMPAKRRNQIMTDLEAHGLEATKTANTPIKRRIVAVELSPN